MNQVKVGKFIAECRKQNGYTQAELAEKLGLSDKTISKWENGRGLPDATNMLELCNIFNINVNELLNGERLKDMDNYKEIAEKNLIEMKEMEERHNRQHLKVGNSLGCIAVLAGFIIILENFVIEFILKNFESDISVINNVVTPITVCIGVLIWFAVIIYWLPKESTIGYYECPNCNNVYLPDIKAASKAPTKGAFSKEHKRKLKCPKCDCESYHRRVFSK